METLQTSAWANRKLWTVRFTATPPSGKRDEALCFRAVATAGDQRHLSIWSVDGMVYAAYRIESEDALRWYVREYHRVGSEKYFTDHQFGAIWVGSVPTPEETGGVLGISTRPLSALPHDGEAWRDQECALLAGHPQRSRCTARSDPGGALVPEGGQLLGQRRLTVGSDHDRLCDDGAGRGAKSMGTTLRRGFVASRKPGR